MNSYPHVRTAAAALALIVLSACSTRRESSNLFTIEQALATSPAGADLGHAVLGEWDRMCIVLPRSSQAQVDSAIGAPWRGFQDTGMIGDDAHTLLLFVHERDVESHVLFPRERGEFSISSTHVECTPRADAIFETRVPIHGGAAFIARVPRAATGAP